MKNNTFQAFLAGICIAAGLIVVGYGIKSGLESFSNRERVVSVRGLAEKDIKAVGATISISYGFAGNDSKALLNQIKSRTSEIQNYLKGNDNTKNNDISSSDVSLYDRQRYDSTVWVDGKQTTVPKERYNTFMALTIKTNDVETVEKKANEISIDLINKGMTANVSTNYSFPDLNSIKPALIAESTKNARTAGEQFAKDSKSRLGKIKTASQGQISIVGQYYSSDDDAISSKPANPYYERVRVVSTIVFYLED